ncbi:putative Ig domain-containing protein [Tropicibacter naphthalenivorans]|uniref:Cyclolysin n=1 Tax=Tropicibacter naphthalenivorans TaxID=441103 RepID=A0A0P1GK51_9RHOB|nr:putative Ig domain-containing protein [Tropicibacter naphthalenivorans]CUH76283.1 Cyclolysin [Tropicibacter naphthalenivorans]SMC38957.1 Ca2+-binding protein, RTX toxin-related [Tropicibacter naphthalenivorans]
MTVTLVSVQLSSTIYDYFYNKAYFRPESQSADGRYVVFYASGGPYSDGFNGYTSVYVRDIQTETTVRASIAHDGAVAFGWSGHPTISDDGRYIVFSSVASNLVPDDTNGAPDYFVTDLSAGTIERFQPAGVGVEPNASSSGAVISGDGRFVVFDSVASNLVQGDTNNTADVFVHDLQTGVTDLVSRTNDGTIADGVSDDAAISADGRFVAFRSRASNLLGGDTNGEWNIFLRDRELGTTTLINVGNDGALANDSSFGLALSDDGRFVAFRSFASNLVAGDTNAVSDVFVRDLVENTTVRVSVASDGTQGDAPSYEPVLSADGRFVAFTSRASNLVEGDTNGFTDVFVHDLLTGETVRVNVAEDGTQANAGVQSVSISADGQFITFDTPATNLIADGTYVHDIYQVTNPLFGGTAANRAPVWTGDTALSHEVGGSVDLALGLLFTDADGDALTFTVGDLPDGLTYDAASNRITGQVSVTGQYEVALTATDPSGATAEAVLTWDVTPGFQIDMAEFAARMVAYNIAGDDWAPDSSTIEAVIAANGYTRGAVIYFDGFAAVPLLSDTGAPILAIRGSADLLRDWAIADSDPLGVGVTQLENAWALLGSGTLRDWFETHGQNGVHLTGHSLGGAQAQLLASLASQVGYQVNSVSTFNSAGIPDSYAQAADAALIWQVHHWVSAGDVVSLAGEGFLDGAVTIYDLDTVTVANAAMPLVHFAHAHASQWANPAMYGSDFDLVPFTNRMEVPERITWTDSTDLSLEDYSPAFSNGFVDKEYLKFVYAMDAWSGLLHGTAKGQMVDLLMTRGTVEGARTQIGAVLRLIDEAAAAVGIDAFEVAQTAGILANAVYEALAPFFVAGAGARLLIGRLVSAAKLLYDIGVDAVVGIANWTIDTATGFLDFIETSADGLYAWGAETFAGVGDWGSETWDGLSGWATGAIEALGTWRSDRVMALSDWNALTFVKLGGMEVDQLLALGGWTAESLRAFGEWTDGTLNAAVGWTVDTITSLAGWSAGAILSLETWEQRSVENLINWSADRLALMGDWTVESFIALKDFNATQLAILQEAGLPFFEFIRDTGATMLQALAGTAHDGFVNIVGLGRDSLDALGDWSVDQLRALGNMSADAWAKFSEFTVDQARELAGLSVDLTQRIIAGGVSGYEAVKGAVGEAGSSAYQTILHFGSSIYRWKHQNPDADLTPILAPKTEKTGQGSLLGGGTAESFTLSSGNDVLLPGGGFDVARLGAGLDEISGDGAALDGLLVHDFTGDDRLRLQGSSFGAAAIAVTYGSAILDIDLDGDGIADTTIVLEGDFHGAAFVVEQDGADTILRVIGARNGIQETGTAGADHFVGSPGNDRINVGDGNDLIDGRAGADSILGGGGADTLIGDLGQDTLLGEVGNDLLQGGDDNDTLDGGFSHDTLQGGAGDDLLIGGYGDDSIDGGTGIDTADYSGFGGNIVVNLNITGAQNTNAGGTDTLTGIENLIGGDHADRLTGRTNDSLLEGGASSDRLYGLGGDDTLDGQTGNDQLLGGTGADLLIGGTGYDVLLGGSESDTLDGGSGNDQLRGGDGADTLEGGIGRDILIGGEFTGGGFPGDGAADVFVFNSAADSTRFGAGRDIIRDFEDGLDMIDVSGIDADEGTAGNQAFTLIGTAAFSHTAGELRYVNTAAATLLRGDTDGDGVADFDVYLNGVIALDGSDFIL